MAESSFIKLVIHYMIEDLQKKNKYCTNLSSPSNALSDITEEMIENLTTMVAHNSSKGRRGAVCQTVPHEGSIIVRILMEIQGARNLMMASLV